MFQGPEGTPSPACPAPQAPPLTCLWPRTPHPPTRASSPSSSNATAGTVFSSLQPCPAWQSAPLSRAHPWAHVPAWPWLILEAQGWTALVTLLAALLQAGGWDWTWMPGPAPWRPPKRDPQHSQLPEGALIVCYSVLVTYPSK